MVRVIECTEGHYDVREVEFGEVYRWRPESVVVECGCGERLTLTGSATTCGECGADHAATVQAELSGRRPERRPEDETLHPWRYAGESEGRGIPF